MHSGRDPRPRVKGQILCYNVALGKSHHLPSVKREGDCNSGVPCKDFE